MIIAKRAKLLRLLEAVLGYSKYKVGLVALLRNLDLTTQVQSSPQSALFLISLPIGPIIPRHYYAWVTDQEAADWLSSCGLEIMEHHAVYVQPAVDLFAEQLGANYHDFYARWRKK
jgi:hypothetical protein